MEDKYDTVKLCYTIHKYSSHSSNYIPENIMVNNPSDELSRWFTDNNTPSQFIMLKLKSASIVETIKFGKYIKAHVSDLKKFQVYGGTDENNLSLLLSSGLKKDNSAEVFRLRHRTAEGLYFPVNFIKIVPVQSWGPAYNYTIWYVELQGKNHPDLMNKALNIINLRKEEEAVRLILKHMRRRNYKDAFEALSRESGVQLEGALQARLWEALVENADFTAAEDILKEAVETGEFDWYMSWQPYTAVWRQLSQCSATVEQWLACDGPATANQLPCSQSATQDVGSPLPDMLELSGYQEVCERPGPRGGHQLVVDSTTGTLYLFGGWNGTEDLDDLWSYDTKAEKWALLCRHSNVVNGPSPRSCHKMVFDPVNRKLYTLGRYIENAQRLPGVVNSDLYVYDICSGEWSQICADTSTVGGPKLVFDHQMCIDADTQTIYVFGGRILPTNTKESMTSPQYSGLYAYYIATNSWHQLLPDNHADPASPQPRVSHSMLFHPIQRCLYILAGQRNKEQLVEVWRWDVQDGARHCLCSAPPAPPPPAGFTLRATLDPPADTLYVLSGMSKEKVHNTLWEFSLKTLRWRCIYRNDMVTPNEPRPRFAHQLVFDPVTKTHYLFGGNAGINALPRVRLDDLWSLVLQKPQLETVLNEMVVMLREACYRQVCAMDCDKLEALNYLRECVHNAKQPEEKERFHKLTIELFAPSSSSECPPALTSRRVRFLRRARAAASRPAACADTLRAVLGADDSIPEPTVPIEDIIPEEPESWDVGCDWDAAPPSPASARRWARVLLYERLAAYWRPSRAPPAASLEHSLQL